MPAEFYKVLHLVGVLGLFTALGGLAMIAWMTRGAQAVKDEVTTARKRLTMLHGIALLVIFVAGFGLMARMGMMKGWPLWIYGKLAIWLLLGASVALVRRMPERGRQWILLLPIIGGVAAYLAVYHPF